MAVNNKRLNVTEFDFDEVKNNLKKSELSILYGDLLVSSNPAFLAYLGPPISHIRQNPKNARNLHYFLFSPIFPIPPLREPPIELSTQSPK